MNLEVGKIYINLAENAGRTIKRKWNGHEECFYVPKIVRITKCNGLLVGTNINNYECVDDKGNTVTIDDDDLKHLLLIESN